MPNAAFDLLDKISEALFEFKAKTTIFSVRTVIELPKESYDRFTTSFQEVCPKSDPTNFDYGTLRFSVIEQD